MLLLLSKNLLVLTEPLDLFLKFFDLAFSKISFSHIFMPDFLNFFVLFCNEELCLIQLFLSLCFLISSLVSKLLEGFLFSSHLSFEIIIYQKLLFNLFLKIFQLLLTDGIIWAHPIGCCNINFFCLALNKYLLPVEHVLQLELMSNLLLIPKLFLQLFDLVS